MAYTRRTQQQWQQLINEHPQSGLTVKDYCMTYIRHVDCNRLIKMRVGKRSQDVSSVDHRFFRNRSKQTLMHSVL